MRTPQVTGPGVPGGSARAAYRAARRARRVAWGRSTVLALVGAGLLVGAAGATRWRWVLVAAGGVALLVAWRRWPQPDPERWQRGAEGEEATAAVLERLPRRWVVLHDRRIPGSRANIDHLVIGRAGVFVVDSKARRGRLRARWRSVTAGERPVDTAPATWQATVVRDHLDVEVRALVVVHGHGLRRRGRRVGGARVVPIAGLRRCLRRRRLGGRLRRADVVELGRLAALAFPEA